MFDSEEVQSIIDQLNGLTATKPHAIPQDFTEVLRNHKGRYTKEQAELALNNILPAQLWEYVLVHHYGYLSKLAKEGLCNG